MGVLFGTINGVSHGGLVEAISGLWQTDESSQKIVTEMTDYHVRLDSVYAPKILECTEKRLIFAGSFGLVIYDRQSERVSATIDLQKIESNHFNADTLQTRFLIQGDELVIYNLQMCIRDRKKDIRINRNMTAKELKIGTPVALQKKYVF